MQKVKELKYIKLHKDAKLMPPSKTGDAGFDIGFVECSQKGEKSGTVDERGNVVYYTGIAIEMPETAIKETTMACIGVMKSSGSDKALILANCIGVIDFGYRGEICFKFKQIGFSRSVKDRRFNINEFIGQLIFIPVFSDMELSEVSELSETGRGEKGYGEATKNRK